jgi:hypothetical protein
VDSTGSGIVQLLGILSKIIKRRIYLLFCKQIQASQKVCAPPTWIWGTWQEVGECLFLRPTYKRQTVEILVNCSEPFTQSRILRLVAAKQF